MSPRPTVLVVDDDRTIADLYATWLSAEYDVETAYGGPDALEALDESIRVVVLDRRMPQTSGDEVLAEIRERGVDCRVAMVTAVDPGYDILEMGFDAYVTKPAAEAEIKGVVERLVRRSAYADTTRELFAKLAKREALEAEKPVDELEREPRYRRLVDEIEELRARSEVQLGQLDEEDFEALFHRLDRS